MGSFFQWDPAVYGLQVPRMDEEHQGIIASMNRLHELRESGAPRPELQREVDQLVRLTVRHFSDEEAYMESIRYPELAKHKLIHKGLLEKVSGHKDQFEASGKLTDDFFVFLRMWLKSHICGIDTQYAAHGRPRGS
jgi:hemerythrin-like metal-binding protein